MPIDVSPGSFAAFVITTLFWWTVLLPAGLLAVAVLCGRRPFLRGALTIVVLAPPIVTLLPVAVMHGGIAAAAAVVAATALAVAVALAVLGLVRTPRGALGADSAGREDAGERYATAALLTGVAGGMVGSLALVGALLFS